MQAPNAELFWNQFVSQMDELHVLVVSGRTRDAFDRIGKLLSAADFTDVYELTSDDDFSILIFSPEGDVETAKRIDLFVNAAPHLPRWKVFNRRQRKDVSEAIVFAQHVYNVDLSDATLAFERVPGGLVDVVMYSNVAAILGEDEKVGFVTFFLEHALGEEATMKTVGARTISLPNGAPNAMSPREFVTAINGEMRPS